MSRGGPGLHSQGFFYWPSMEKRRPSPENRRLSCPALPTHHFRAPPPPLARRTGTRISLPTDIEPALPSEGNRKLWMVYTKEWTRRQAGTVTSR